MLGSVVFRSPMDGSTLSDMAYRFTPADRAAFKRCRRQWDFGARERQNLEPVEAATAPTWIWPSTTPWPATTSPGCGLVPLGGVAAGPPGVRPVGRPPVGGRELVLDDGRLIRFQGRVDLLAGDAHDRYWVVRHRVVDRFGAADDLLLDEEPVAACWAMERLYPGDADRRDGPQRDPTGESARRNG